MSSGSDWVNLFVHQGKEFIDSVSGQRKRNVLVSETDPSSKDSFNFAKAFSNASKVDSGLVSPEETSSESSLKEVEGSSMDSSSITSSSGASGGEKMALTEGEKAIYENQLEQLQEQLVDIMIKNQEMEAELASLRESDVSKLTRELDREKIKRKQLEVKLKRVKSENDSVPKLRKRKLQRVSSEQSDQSTSFDHQATNNVQTPSSVQYEPPLGDQSRISHFKLWLYRWYISLSQSITLIFWNIMSDLSDDDIVGEPIDKDGPPLSVKTLKENINRFSSGIKPIKEFITKVTWVLSWKNPAATMLIFLVYVFSFWHGFAVPLVLFLFIVQLSANYIYCRFGSISDKDEPEAPPEPPSWSDRFQVIVHVARKVQNILGTLSDHLEKIKNLLTWKVYHVTLRLYVALWLLFAASLFLAGSNFFTLIGMMLGYKLFVTNPLYNRFPKLKKRYDTTHRLWLELPTDCEVGTEPDKQTDLDEFQRSGSYHQLSIDESTLSSELFCERYKLTSDEVFVRGWEVGWRTSLMNKNKPLVNIKHGRLYLTQNYLCFERSRTNAAKNTLIKLSDIRCVNKYKPLFILPGTGMSIEVCMKDKDEPYIFGAMIGRDDAYNDIIQTARRAGLSWAT